MLVRRLRNLLYGVIVDRVDIYMAMKNSFVDLNINVILFCNMNTVRDESTVLFCLYSW